MHSSNIVTTCITKVAKLYCKIAEFIVITSLFLLVSDLGIGVIMRYTMKFTFAWYEDAAKIFLIWLALSGSVLASDKSEHVSINVFPKSTPEVFKKVIKIIVQMIVLLTALFMVYYGYHFALRGRIGVFPSMDIVPLYVSYAAIPFGYLGIFIVTLKNTLHIIQGTDLQEKPAIES